VVRNRRLSYRAPYLQRGLPTPPRPQNKQRCGWSIIFRRAQRAICDDGQLQWYCGGSTQNVPREGWLGADILPSGYFFVTDLHHWSIDSLLSLRRGAARYQGNGALAIRTSHRTPSLL